MALCATQISCIHCWKAHTVKSWQTCTMRGTSASSGVPGGCDPLTGDGDFGGWKEGPVLGQGAVWAQLKSPHCQEGGEGLVKGRPGGAGEGVPALPEPCPGWECRGRRELAGGPGRCGEKGSSAAAERQAPERESSSAQGKRWKSFG